MEEQGQLLLEFARSTAGQAGCSAQQGRQAAEHSRAGAVEHRRTGAIVYNRAGAVVHSRAGRL